MSNWYEVKWSPTEQYTSLPAALNIVQHYLLRRRGDVAYDDVAFASSFMLTEFRKGEKRQLMLANKAINALEERSAEKKRVDVLTFEHRVC